MKNSNRFIYKKGIYKVIDRDKIAEDIQKEGFNPILITDKPGFIYQEHRHPETKLLIFLKGGMCVAVGGEHYKCRVGDKLIVPGNTLHSAKVDSDGCSFFWSEKIL